MCGTSWFEVKPGQGKSQTLHKPMDLSSVTDFFLQLEGPYRWYVLAAVLVIITTIVTRFVFKTVKWLMVIAALILIVMAAVKLVG